MPVGADSIDELLRLAGVSPDNSGARGWLESALLAARSLIPSDLAARGATRAPPPAKHNAPLEKIQRASDKLIEALKKLECYPYACASFWRFAGFGPIYNNEYERPDVLRTLTDIRNAARKGQISKIGRPRKSRKQLIVDSALAFCARYSSERPSGDANNFFRAFAERFYELSTGLSPEMPGNGIERQIRQALRRLPIELERAARG